MVPLYFLVSLAILALVIFIDGGIAVVRDTVVFLLCCWCSALADHVSAQSYTRGNGRCGDDGLWRDRVGGRRGDKCREDGIVRDVMILVHGVEDREGSDFHFVVVIDVPLLHSRIGDTPVINQGIP